MEYRDVHSSSKSADKYLEHLNKSSMSDKQKEDVEKFVSLLKIGKIGKKVKDRKITNYLQFLIKLDKYFKKDLDKITEKDAEQFYKDLQDDKIKKNNGMPFAPDSKNMFVVSLKRYLGWKWGRDSKKYHKCLRWMKEITKKSEKKAITLKEAEKVSKQEENIRNKALFMYLFCSGARIEEALNTRILDLKFNDGDKTKYYIVHIRGQKTEESDRTIPIPIATKYIDKWLKKHPTKDDEESFLFPIQYDNARKIIRLMTEKALGFKLKPHELRHSSATHYIQFGGFGAENIGGFYYRYGWKFGSDEALTYIKQYMYGGELSQDKVVQHIVSDKIEQLEKEIEALKQANEILKPLIDKVLEKEDITIRYGDNDIVIPKKK